MEIKLGRWEKGDMQRIYFNSGALGEAKVYACANKRGIFTVRNYITTPGQSGAIYDAENKGVALIEKLIGKPISYDTKFADIWAAIKQEIGK
jgi:hypothetical protein